MRHTDVVNRWGAIVGRTLRGRPVLVLAILVGIFVAALGLPKTAVAQPAGTVCPAIDDNDSFSSGATFFAVQQSTNLTFANCSSQTTSTNSYDRQSVAGANSLIVLNNVNDTGPVSPGISVTGGTNVTNILFDGAPYTSGTRIALATAGAFSGVFRFDFGGDTFQFTVVKSAASNTLQSFTIEAVAKPPTVAASPLRTQRVINNFMVQRADQIVAGGPDIAGRLTGGLGGADGSAADVSANGAGGSFNAAFATSLRQIASSHAGAYAMDIATAAGLDDAATTAPANGFDLWAKGAWSRLDSGDTTSDLALVHIGADYRLSDDLLIGVLGQVDWSDEDNDTTSAKADGLGWMAGPYAAARVHEHLIVDARAAWGRSDNDVSPTGAHTDSFKTKRWLVSGGLTGDIRVDNWHLTPGIEATYFREKQDSYTDSVGVLIPNRTISLGQLTFGPEAAYLYRPAEDWVIGPRAGVQGIWNFTDAEVVDIATGATGGSDDLRMRTEGGVSVTYDARYTVIVDGFYDGIGADNYSAFGGSLAIHVLIVEGMSLTGESYMSGSGSAIAGDDAITIGGIDVPADYGINLTLKWRF